MVAAAGDGRQFQSSRLFAASAPADSEDACEQEEGAYRQKSVRVVTDLCGRFSSMARRRLLERRLVRGGLPSRHATDERHRCRSRHITARPLWAMLTRDESTNQSLLHRPAV
ncbi:hypothetical protein [Rhizobium giardinii]|uniref:hypothetical protein n=1 Tax=Rhizobium giardinii TaxID=56731 RepID=UPI003D6F8CF3